MIDNLQKVREFHVAISALVASEPSLLACDSAEAAKWGQKLIMLRDRVSLDAKGGDSLGARLAMALEELAEWVEAHAAGDLVAAADAWGDRQYLLLGDAVATGLPVEEIFDEVHRSNMTKTRLVTDALGKAQKDEGFRHPRLASIVGRCSVE